MIFVSTQSFTQPPSLSRFPSRDFEGQHSAAPSEFQQ
jgi:hypothetical protein